MYFNDVTINTLCPYHNFGENDSQLSASVHKDELQAISIHFLDIGFCQDLCNYALVPHSPQNRKQFGKGFEDISVIFTVVPTLHSPCFLWPSTLKVKVTRDSEKVCHGMYMVNSNFNMFSRDVTVLMLFNSVSHLVLQLVGQSVINIQSVRDTFIQLDSLKVTIVFDRSTVDEHPL